MDINERRAKVSECLNQGHFIIGIVAKRLNLTDLEVLEVMPPEMSREIPVDDFFSLWTTLTTWENALFLAQSSAAIVEVEGKLPQGQMGRGMFNLHDKSLPLGGHLEVDKIVKICLIAKNLDSHDSLGVHFFTKDGSTGFAVYAGRGEGRKIIPDIRESYKALWAKYTVL
ncbi:MAG: heme utilization cystosolic carrier protein HutX [Deltaproteobacteria bacterium]|jgi:putative heme utilization carrier protein HutX|nr:heme utilization cystosolic carrier protein HutX [Deltaproteobacteria bacterium]